MSGPKVVTIVTREEIIAICESMIASLEVALRQWERLGERNGVISAADREMMTARVKAMRAMLAADQFDALQKQIPREIGFLQTDMEKRIEAAAERAAQVQMEGTRRVRAARKLASALQQKGIPVTPALQKPEALPSEDLNRAISAAFEMLVGSDALSGTTDRQRELAAKLGGEESRLTLSQWLDHQPQEVGDRTVVQLRRRFAELKSYDEKRAAEFEVRLEQCLADQSERRGLLLDSLALDIGEAKKMAVEIASVTQTLAAVAGELRAFQSVDANALAGQINQVLEANASLEQLRHLEANANDAVAKLRAERANRERRNAVLQGLAKLGYEVQEGMQAAWVENGRVILRSKKSGQYGVELGGDPSRSMQVRTVAFSVAGSVIDPIADIAAETEFCGDFSKLQERLVADGGSLSIVKALGVGTTPVKRIGVEAASQAREDIDIPVVGYLSKN